MALSAFQNGTFVTNTLLTSDDLNAIITTVQDTFDGNGTVIQDAYSTGLISIADYSNSVATTAWVNDFVGFHQYLEFPTGSRLAYTEIPASAQETSNALGFAGSAVANISIGIPMSIATTFQANFGGWVATALTPPAANTTYPISCIQSNTTISLGNVVYSNSSIYGTFHASNHISNGITLNPSDVLIFSTPTTVDNSIQTVGLNALGYKQ